MAVVQIECTCEVCHTKWYYLPFEEARMILAEILRIRTRDLSWRERRRYFGRPGYSGCGCSPGCGNAGCSFLEGFACAELFNACGGATCCGEAACLPGCGVSGIALLLPFTNWLHPLIRMLQIQRIPALHRMCPNCGSGWFERVVAKYEENGTRRQVEAVSWALPVVNP
jgi:hypothetical protein